MQFLLMFLVAGVGGLAAKGSTPDAQSVDRKLGEAEQLGARGHAEDARRMYESLISSLSQASSAAQLGRALDGLSKISATQGRYEEAIRFARESSESFRRAGDSHGEAHALNNLAIAEEQQGDYPSARADLEKALKLSRMDRDDEAQVKELNNFGSAFYFPGDYSEAFAKYEQAEALIVANANAPWNGYWQQITEVNRATLLQRLGKLQEALEIYKRVDTSLSLTPSDRAHLYANTGALYRRLGDPNMALAKYRSAQSLYAHERDADGELAVLKNIGIAYALDLADLQRAEDIFKKALALAEKTKNRREEMQAGLYLAETLLRAHFPVEARAAFERALSLANELSTIEEQWKSLYGLGRVSLLEGNKSEAEGNFRKSIEFIEKTRNQLPLSTLRVEFFADKRDAYDALTSLLLARHDTADAFAFMERSRARSFQDRINARAQSGRTAITLDSVRASLAPDTALLEYWVGEHQFGLIWCTNGASGMMLRQIPAADESRIHDLIERLPDSLEAIRQGGTPLDLLMPDASALPKNVRHLLLVPDGWISSVPFDLLRSPANPGSLLVENFDITLLPTASLLVRPHVAEKAFHLPWTRQLIAFGDPVANASSGPKPVGLDGNALQSLPYSGEEIRSIKRVVSGTSELLLGRQDLKGYFFDGRANSAFILHVSTHAFADIENPENSRMLFSPGPEDAGAANYVFLRELYGLDLSQVRLATLSACDTERGALIRGEGVQAFGRAFLSAGAASALTSLWRVDDQPTAGFMQQFYYFALVRHTSKAEALQLAKLKFLHSGTRLSEPRVWATFVMSGDGLTPLPYVVSWSVLVVCVCLAVILATLPFVVARLRRGSRIHRENEAGRVVTQQSEHL